MKSIFFSLFIICSLTAANAQKIEYTPEDSVKIESVLKDAITKRATEENQMLYFGKQFLGIPYVAHTLENGNSEHLIVNVHGLDCTTFVETVLALKMCDDQNKRSFRDFCDNLTKIRYRNGIMDQYPSRLHYFTWWGEDNEQLGLVKQVAVNDFPFNARQTIDVNYMTRNPNLYKQLKNHPEFIRTIRKFEMESNGKVYRYIPKQNLKLTQASLGMYVHDGDIVSIITNKPGLDTSHIGIVFWKGGVLHLMHASSLAKKVIMDTKTFYNYSMGQNAHLGIRVYRPLQQMSLNSHH